MSTLCQQRVPSTAVEPRGAGPGSDALRRVLKSGKLLSTPAMAVFPSMKARQLRRVLARPPLSYTKAEPGKGSHMTLISSTGYQNLTWAFHDGDTLAPGLVRKILVKDVGMTEDDARKLL